MIGDEFTKENIQILARAMADKMRAEGVADKGIVIGYDRRFLSKEAMQWAGQVFAQEGITAYLINKSAPTPLVMFYVIKHEFAYGMMITASHNPLFGGKLPSPSAATLRALQTHVIGQKCDIGIATDAVIGGESSGGLTVRGHIKGKDGIYAAALPTALSSRTRSPT